VHRERRYAERMLAERVDVQRALGADGPTPTAAAWAKDPFLDAATIPS
jgi:hypothetical protein